MIDHGASGGISTITGLSFSAQSDLAPGSRLAGRFTIEKRIGSGGMGVVYQARDDALGITVALKLLRPEFATRPDAFERFRQELLLARQVSNPRVVRIHDIAQDAGQWFISMDFVEGTTLDRWLDANGAVAVDQAVKWTRQIAEGLEAAHAKGIVHRDLKPSNILIDAQGNACIGDFGVARSMGTTGLTQPGSIVGTPDYLSPEQARGDDVDARADLYALGLIMYEMLTGKPAFADATPAESIARRLSTSPAGVEEARPDTPLWLARIVSRLLKRAPSHRFHDARALITALDHQREPRFLRWRPFTAIILVVMLLLAMAAAYFYMRAEPASLTAAPVPPARIAVVASHAGSERDPQLEGAAEALRLTLSERPDLAVVDGYRTHLAMAKSTMGSSEPASAKSVARILGAERLINIYRRAAPEGTVFLAEFGRVGEEETQTITSQPHSSPASALRELDSALQRALGAPTSPTSSSLTGQEDLAALGDAMQLFWSGRTDAATDALSDLSKRQPFNALALASLGDCARIAGRRSDASAALQALASLPGAPLSRFTQPWRAALDGTASSLSDTGLSWPSSMDADPGLRMRIAELALEIGDLESAKQSLLVAVSNDPQDPRAWFLSGKASILSGDHRTAVEEQLVRALILFKRSRDLRGEAETVNALGVGYARLGQTNDAEEQYQRALSLRRQLGDRRGTASSLRNLAQIDLIRGDHTSAATRLQEAGELFAELGDLDGLAAVENERGLLEEERGDYREALSAYRRGLRTRERGGNQLGVAESLNNIAFAHHQLGDYENAQALWLQARLAFEALGDTNGVVRVDQNLGLLSVARGDWRSARERLNASLATSESNQMLEEAAVSLRNLVELDITEGRLDTARRNLDRAAQLFDSRDDERGRVDAQLLAAQLLLASDNPEEALQRLEEIPEASDLGSTEQAAIAALMRIKALLATNRTEEALAASKIAARLAERSGVRALQVEAAMLSASSPDASIADSVAQLGNVPIHLQWLERELTMQLALGDDENARRVLQQAREIIVVHPTYGRRHVFEALAKQIDTDADRGRDALR